MHSLNQPCSHSFICSLSVKERGKKLWDFLGEILLLQCVVGEGGKNWGFGPQSLCQIGERRGRHENCRIEALENYDVKFL